MVNTNSFTGLSLGQSSFPNWEETSIAWRQDIRRSFIHIDDVCEGTQRAAEQGNTGEVFHFATSENISIRSLVEMISERLGVRFEDHVEVAGERLGKDAAYLLDCTLAKERLQWEHRISLGEGLDRTTGWVKDNLESLLRQPQNYIHKP